MKTLDLDRAQLERAFIENNRNPGGTMRLVDQVGAYMERVRAHWEYNYFEKAHDQLPPVAQDLYFDLVELADPNGIPLFAIARHMQAQRRRYLTTSASAVHALDVLQAAGLVDWRRGDGLVMFVLSEKAESAIQAFEAERAHG